MKTGFFAQFTPEQMRKAYGRNAIGLVQMADKAVKTGKKVNGYRAGQLVMIAIQYDKLAQTF